MQTMMDALVKEAPGKGLTLKRVPVPQPGIGEVQHQDPINSDLRDGCAHL